MSKDLQSVRVTVHSGKVKDADWVGKSDPYVILSLDGTKWKSVTKDNTLTPEWNETWEFPIKSQNPVLEIQCYDADPGKKDDPLGEGKLDIGPLRHDPEGVMRHKQVPLFLKGKEEGWIDVSVVASWKIAQETGASAATAEKVKSIALTVKAGKGFTKGDVLTKPDPYVKVYTMPHRKLEVFETRTQKNTAEPVWEETHNFDTVGEKEFKIEVYDKDKVGKDDLLGEIQVPFKELGLQHGASSRWIPVFNNQAPGKSRLSIRASGFGKKEMKQSGEVHLHYVPNMGGQDFYPKPSGSGSHTAPPVPPIIAPSKGPTKKPSGVKVTVIEGYNLKGKDLIGKADPYCEVSKQYPNPVWDASHYFDLTRTSASEIEFNIKDKDRFSKDDDMGTASVRIADLETGARRIPIHHKGDAAGDLLVEFNPEYPSSHAPAHTPAPAPPPLVAPPVSHKPHGPLRSLRVTVKEAKDLPSEGGLGGSFGKVDPFVKITTRSDTWQTSVKKNTHDPVWEETHDFNVEGSESISINVFDKDLFGKDALCETKLRPDDLNLHEGYQTKWIPLYKPKKHKDGGALHLGLEPTFAPLPEDKPHPPPALPPRPQPHQPAAPAGPHTDPEKQRQIAELKRQIAQQQQKNLDLKKHYEEEAARLRRELDEERGFLRRHGRGPYPETRPYDIAGPRGYAAPPPLPAYRAFDDLPPIYADPGFVDPFPTFDPIGPVVYEDYPGRPVAPFPGPSYGASYGASYTTSSYGPASYIAPQPYPSATLPPRIL